jgi:hypothetical protein
VVEQNFFPIRWGSFHSPPTYTVVMIFIIVLKFRKIPGHNTLFHLNYPDSFQTLTPEESREEGAVTFLGSK